MCSLIILEEIAIENQLLKGCQIILQLFLVYSKASLDFNAKT